MRSLGLGFSLATLLSFATFAQTKPSNEPANASISGRVTLDGKPARGVTVLALPSGNTRQPRASASAKTDVEGRYRLTGLPAGGFNILAAAREYVSSHWENRLNWQGHAVTLNEGEQYEAPDLVLVRGGVIVGRVTDAMGRPLIEEPVRLYRVNEQGQKILFAHLFAPEVRTDDRGVYRVYGLPAGRYLVAAGNEENERTSNYPNRRRRVFKLTYHPETTLQAQAKVLNVSAGSEHTDINIKLGNGARGQDVTVRVMDAATGQPVRDVNIGYGIVDRSSSVEARGSSTRVTDNQGETQLVGVLPGRYVAFLTYGKNGKPSEFHVTPQPFEVSTDEATRIELMARRGAQVSGMVKFERLTDPVLLARAKALKIGIRRQAGDTLIWQTVQSTLLAEDFSFQLAGLAAGKWQFELPVYDWTKGFALARIEHNGRVLNNELELSDGASVSGLRLVVTYNDGRLKGQVNIVGGTLPPDAVIRVAAFPGESNSTRWGTQADARGQFVIEYLPAGAYVLSVFATVRTTEASPNTTPVSFLSRQIASVKQAIVMDATGETQVNITLNLSAQGRRQ